MSRSHHRPPHQGAHTQGSISPARPEGSSESVTTEMASEHRPGLLPEKYFRWRSGEITRLEAFCDVVFGFALTLLVVSLEVPRTYAELMAAIRGFVPFAACFAQLVLIWRAHYRFSRRYGLEDPYTVFLNTVLLFLVLFFVYPLKFVFTMLFQELTGNPAAAAMTFHEVSVLMRIYAAGFASVFTIFALMYFRAYKVRAALRLNPVEVLETQMEVQQNVIMAAIGVLAFALAFEYPALSGWSYCLLGPALTIHGMIAGKRVRLMAEKIGIA